MACICPKIRVEDSLNIQNEVWLEVTQQYDIIIWSLLGLVCTLLVLVICLVVYILRKIETRTHHLPPILKERGTSTSPTLTFGRGFPFEKYSPRPSTSNRITTVELKEWNKDDAQTPPPVID